MGILALSDFVTEITANVGARTDLTFARIVTALNFAQDEISKAQDFKELQIISTALSTNYTGVPIADKFLSYPSNWKTIHSIVLQYGINSRKLKNMPWRKFDRQYPAPEAVAAYIPLVYTDWQRQLLFMPVPNAVYPLQCRVTQYPTPFTVNTAQTTTSSFMGKDDILVDFAAAYLWKSFGRYDKASAAQDSALAKLEVAKKADSERPDLDTTGSADDSGPLSGAYWANPWITSIEG